MCKSESMQPQRTGTKTAEQVAELFGVAPRTVYKWRYKGLIEGQRVGHYLLFADAEVARFERQRYGVTIQDEDQVAS